MRALTIPGLTTDDDVRWLAARAAEATSIIEIGPFRGRSTRALVDGTPGHVYAIDNWNASFNGGRSDMEARADFYRNLDDVIGTRVTVFECSSQDGRPAGLDGIVADMLWIDGDHSYEAVRADIQTYAPLVRAGGLICGHDYSPWHPGVVQAVDEAFGGPGGRVRTVARGQSIWWIAAP